MIKKQAVQEVEVKPNMRGGPGSVLLAHCFRAPDFGVPVRLCAKLVITPGSGIGLHEHAGEDELYYVIKGAGLLEENGIKSVISAGDAVLTGRGGNHSVLNQGQEDLEILAVIMTYPKA